MFAVLAIAANAQMLTAPGQIDLSVVFSSGLQPLLLGGLVLGVGLSLGGPTGYAINPGDGISVLASRTSCFRFRGSAIRIGATRGFPSSRRSSAGSSARSFSESWDSERETRNSWNPERPRIPDPESRIRI